jgi:hypothetical protein
MFEDQSVELLPARTCMTVLSRGNGGNGGRSGAPSSAAAVVVVAAAR